MIEQSNRLPSDDARWHSVLARDAGADGAFVYAVSTTGVYCRPSCPSRRPRRANVAFFSDPRGRRRGRLPGVPPLPAARGAGR